MSESVLVVPAAVVDREARGRAFFTWPDRGEAEGFVERLNALGVFLPRAEVETDDSWRQVIPYVLLRSPNGTWFTYRRLPRGGESRLVGLHSLGVGGHINDEALVPGLAWRSAALRPNLVAEGLQRELREELELPEPNGSGLGECWLHGFLALNETPVDRVHVGVVVVLDVRAEHVPECRVRERDKLEAMGWLAPDALRALAAREPFEGWSRTLIETGLP